MLKAYYNKEYIECGVDEAGRGALAGDVFAAAVILPHTFRSKMLNDSKQLTDKQRRELRLVIESKALSYAVARVSNQEIDKTNILLASITAMNRAIKQLSLKPEFIIVDGNKFFTDTGIKFQTIVKGDAQYMSIAAASILAKTYRDDYMIELSKQYPNYGWEKNKGYPTKDHRQAIKQYGITPLHRKSFRLLSERSLFDDN